MKKLIVSVICLLSLAIVAFGQETASQITKDKVGQTVKLAGTVESFSASRSETSPASFKLKDSAGESIRVVVWPDVFSQITGKDSIKPGAKVQVSAKVSEYRGAIELQVESAGGITLGDGTSAAPVASTASASEKFSLSATAVTSGSGISSITKDKLKQSVTVSGSVASFSASRNDTAPASFSLKDDSGSIRVAVWPDVFNQIAGKDNIKPGAKVTVKANVAQFRGNLELHVDNGSDVQVSSGSAAVPAEEAAKAASEPAKSDTEGPRGRTGIAGLKDKLNQTVTISGKVAKARKPSSETAPYILNIEGEGGAVDVVFWQTLADQLSPDQKANVGDNVEITGKVGEYRGNVQVKPENPSDFKIIKGSDTSSEDAKTSSQAGLAETPLSQIASAKMNRRVKVTGIIETIERIRTGKRMMLKDPTGSVTLIVWDTAEGGKAGIHAAHVGAKVAVAAIVEQDNGKPVLTVSQPGDVISVVDVGETASKS